MILNLSSQDLGMEMISDGKQVKQRNRLPMLVSHLSHWKV